MEAIMVCLFPQVHELLRTLKSRGVTVLIITHDREEAEQIADRVVRMPIALS